MNVHIVCEMVCLNFFYFFIAIFLGVELCGEKRDLNSFVHWQLPSILV